MKIAVPVVPILATALIGATPALAGHSNPCADAATASPLAPSRGRLSLSHDVAAYTARHAEIACAKLDALLHVVVPGDATTATKVRVVKGELETGVLQPIFRTHPDLGHHDQTADNAPGSAVKIGPPGAPPNPRQMGFATAQHLRWVSSDADRRFLDLIKPIATESPGSKASATQAEQRVQAAAISAIEDITSEISFVDAPGQHNYPQLWKVTQRELEARMPRDSRTAKSDAQFRAASPPPGSVKLSADAAAKLRTFDAAMKSQLHGCPILSILWALSTASRGPDDPAWRETGPSLEVGSYDCRRVPPDAVQTIDGIRMIISSDKDHPFAGKTIDFVGKRFVLK